MSWATIKHLITLAMWTTPFGEDASDFGLQEKVIALQKAERNYQ